MSYLVQLNPFYIVILIRMGFYPKNKNDSVTL